MKYIWVASLPGTYSVHGKSYGPSSKPVQVPEHLAAALGLEEVDAPEQDASETGIKLLGDKSDALRTVLDAQRQIALLFPEQFKDGDELTHEGGSHPLVEAVKQLKAQRDTAQANVIPTDALTRLQTVPGVGEATAQKCLEALKAPPASGN